ncbi:hypothetical protein [Elizabethkingia anophelis]|uniref:hypothetical protein n=1 Tax=Elizabethkingia anophelis TaxID=1117645 RepID=UPI000D02E165|nr:hypothetical protein [Elizabethkingia anophelis]MCL1689424.1 hypothetical protein [Elizabethkingia anophelis]MDV4009445.1 hypothetical protein [Elizabethkingia anophelis]MYY46365.1 hypothetical protein [Elizabethkingia anophelis]PRQ84106.1 hypothetical protein CMT86_17790 [Elizabethkingia anophelis]PRQ85006.1 hypothetical protein CMT87_02240 [Elizabethkingia anophelis]
MKIEKGAFVKILYLSLIGLLYSVLSVKLLSYFGIENRKIGGFRYVNLKQKILISFIIAPLVKTIIFQYMVYEIIFFIKKRVNREEKNNLDFTFLILYILISSCLFAANHNFSIYYMLLMIPPGILLSFSFYYFQRQFSYPIFYVFLVQSLHNILAFVLDNLKA